MGWWVGVGVGVEGVMMFIEMMYLSVVLIDMLSLMILFFGSIRKKFDVGFGVVGMYMFMYFFVRWLIMLLLGVLVRNVIVYELWCGYLISSVLWNVLLLFDSSVLDICLMFV